MPTLYAPGATPVAVTPRGFAVLKPGASAALLLRIRSVLTDGRGLGGVIEALTGAYGASLTAIPPFAVALAEGDAVRVAVRGDFAFDVDAAASERVSGEGVTTWTERVIPAVTRVRLAVEESGAAAPAEFEISDGIVLIAEIVWDAADPRPQPAPGPATAAAGDTPAPAASVSAPAALSAPAPAGSAAAGPAADGSGDDDEPAPGPRRRSGIDARAENRADDGDTPKTDAAPPRVGAPPRLSADPLAPAPALAPPPAPLVPAAGLIDSNSVAAVADAETLLPLDSALHPLDDGVARPTGQVAAVEAGPEAAFDAALGATVIRPSADESPHDGPGATASMDAAAFPVPPIGDHDGATISLAQARALRAAGDGATVEAASVPPEDDGPAPLAPPRPPAPGRVRMSTGQVVSLDRTVVIGRRPRSTRVSGTDLPHLVAVDSPQQDISRSHLELRAEGESIVATDLRTTNGTTLLRPGADPVRLHPGEPTVVVPGDVLDLGDLATAPIEGLS
jgi:hypothetical protein